MSSSSYTQSQFHQHSSTSNDNSEDELTARRKLEHRRLFQQKQGKTATDVDSLMHSMFIDLDLKSKSNSSSTMPDKNSSLSTHADSTNRTKTNQSNQVSASVNGSADWSKIVLDDELQMVFRQEESKIEQTSSANNMIQVNSEQTKVYPDWCMEPMNQLPLVYQQVFEATSANNVIQTSVLYPILLLSGLRQEQLGQIWSQVNRTQPGTLIKEELFMALALSVIPIPNFQIETVEHQSEAIVPVVQTDTVSSIFDQDTLADFTNSPKIDNVVTNDVCSLLDLDDTHLCPLPTFSTQSLTISSQNEAFQQTNDSSLAMENIPVYEQSTELISTYDSNLPIWIRCFEKCHSVFSQANEIFSSIQSPTVCNEVLQQTRARDYVHNLQEIFHIPKRIYTASHIDPSVRAELNSLWKQIIVLWMNLQSFFSTAHLHLLNDDDVDYTPLLANLQKNNFCSICLLSVDGLETVLSSSTISSFNISTITFAGRHYHSSCANFYLNLVDESLPALQRDV